MITDAFLVVLVSLANVIVSLFPDADALPDGVGDFFTTAATYAGHAGAIVPLDQLMLAVGFVLAVETAIFGWRGIEYIARWVRG